MLSDAQKLDILNRALFAFQKQFGVKRDVSDMSISIDKPNVKALCSIFITSNSDNFRIKLNVLAMDTTTSMTAYRSTQLQNYGPGYDDEVVVADITLSRKDFLSFYNYLRSPKFLDEIINDEDAVMDEDDVKIVSEEGFTIVYEDEV